MRALIFLFFAVFSFFSVETVSARNIETGVQALYMWARVPDGDVPTLAVYGQLHNFTETDDALISVSSPLSPQVVINRTQLSDTGYVSMDSVDRILLPAKRYVQLEAGDLHIMAMRVQRQFSAGDEFPLRLVFDKSPARYVRVKVYSPRTTWDDVAQELQGQK